MPARVGDVGLVIRLRGQQWHYGKAVQPLIYNREEWL